MNTAKELIQNLLQSQPEDATYEEIVRELAFDRMVHGAVRSGRCTQAPRGRQPLQVFCAKPTYRQTNS